MTEKVTDSFLDPKGASLVICCFSWFSSAFICLPPCSAIVFVYFPKAFSNGELVNLACVVILHWSEVKTSLPVGNSYSSILPDDKTYIFVAPVLKLYSTFSFVILSSVVIVSFYILSKSSFWNVKYYLMQE